MHLLVYKWKLSDFYQVECKKYRVSLINVLKSMQQKCDDIN